MNRKNIEDRIWGKSISYGQEHGIISKDEAEFLLNEYVKAFQSKVHPRSGNRLLFATK
jgi:hypothetical protein